MPSQAPEHRVKPSQRAAQPGVPRPHLCQHHRTTPGPRAKPQLGGGRARQGPHGDRAAEARPLAHAAHAGRCTGPVQGWPSAEVPVVLTPLLRHGGHAWPWHGCGAGQGTPGRTPKRKTREALLGARAHWAVLSALSTASPPSTPLSLGQDKPLKDERGQGCLQKAHSQHWGRGPVSSPRGLSSFAVARASPPLCAPSVSVRASEPAPRHGGCPGRGQVQRVHSPRNTQPLGSTAARQQTWAGARPGPARDPTGPTHDSEAPPHPSDLEWGAQVQEPSKTWGGPADSR